MDQKEKGVFLSGLIIGAICTAVLLYIFIQLDKVI